MTDYSFFTYLRRNWVELHHFDQLDKIFNNAIPHFIEKVSTSKRVQEKLFSFEKAL